MVNPSLIKRRQQQNARSVRNAWSLCDRAMGNVDACDRERRFRPSGCFSGVLLRSDPRVVDVALSCEQLDSEKLLRYVQRVPADRLASEIEYAERVRRQLALDASYEKRAIPRRQKIRSIIGHDVSELVCLQQLIRVNQTISLLTAEAKYRGTANQSRVRSTPSQPEDGTCVRPTLHEPPLTDVHSRVQTKRRPPIGAWGRARSETPKRHVHQHPPAANNTNGKHCCCPLWDDTSGGCCFLTSKRKVKRACTRYRLLNVPPTQR